MEPFQLFGFEVSHTVLSVFFLGSWIALGWVVEKILIAGLTQLSKKTESRFDDIIIDALSVPLRLLVLVTGLGIIYKFVLPSEIKIHLTHIFPLSLKFLALLSVLIFIDRFIRGLIDNYADRVNGLKSSQSFVQTTVHVVVYFIGLLIILDTVGVSVTPIIASLGLGSLAIALALQPTLENLFSGFQLILDQPIKPGDFIRLESGEEGHVEKIGWRSTWVRQLPNNMVIIPNKQLVNSRVLNYFYPNKETGVVVEMGVHYRSNLEHVEKIVCEVGQQIQRTFPGAVPDFLPFIRYHTFADSSINFSVILRAKEITESFPLKHVFIKAISKRFTEEGITIPYPIRAVNTEQEKAVLP